MPMAASTKLMPLAKMAWMRIALMCQNHALHYVQVLAHDMSIEYVDVYLAQTSILAPLIVALSKRTYLTPAYKWVFFSVIAGTVTEILRVIQYK